MTLPRLLADAYDVALLDLDGVVYVGGAAVPHAAPALAVAAGRGMRLAYVTNNAARPPDAVAGQLRSMGVPAEAGDVVTSAQAAATVLAGMLPAGAPVLVLGAAGLADAVRDVGLRVVTRVLDGPAAVVNGYDPTVDYDRLTEAALAIRTGVPWVATNLDATIPSGRGLLPGNGALTALLRAATDRTPVAAGKPELPLHREAVRRSGATHPLVVGDRLDTDIAGAVAAGVDSLLVLTGVARPADLLRAGPDRRPTYIGADLRALVESPPLVHPLEGGARCGRWTAVLTGLELRLDGPAGDRIDRLRAACGAVWAGWPDSAPPELIVTGADLDSEPGADPGAEPDREVASVDATRKAAPR